MAPPSARRSVALAALLLTITWTPAVAADSTTAVPAPASGPATEATARIPDATASTPGATSATPGAAAVEPTENAPAGAPVENGTPGAGTSVESGEPGATSAPDEVAAPVPAPPPGAVPASVPTEPRDRVAYHVRQAERIAAHLRSIVNHDCPRFATSAQWDAYVAAETDQMTLLVAHLDQAWTEAKRTGDDDVRRAAKAPRRRLDEARALLDKLETCAERNGTELEPGRIIARVQRDVPRVQAEIALPQ